MDAFDRLARLFTGDELGRRRADDRQAEVEDLRQPEEADHQKGHCDDDLDQREAVVARGT
jgi:hypothetical protein